MDEEAEPVAEVEHHSPADFAAAWENMGDADRVRLGKVAAVLQRLPMLSARDLLQEVYVRAFSGVRRWPVGLKFMVFVVETMRSVADDASKKAARSRSLKLVSAQPMDPRSSLWIADPAGNEMPVQRPTDAEESLLSTEEEAAAIEKLKARRLQVLDLFEDDEKARSLVEGMLQGLEGRELQELAGLSGTAFASKRRLVRRRIERLEEEIRAGRKQA